MNYARWVINATNVDLLWNNWMGGCSIKGWGYNNHHICSAKYNFPFTELELFMKYMQLLNYQD